MTSRRESAREIIARVLAATAGCDERTIRRALRAAYPWGSRRRPAHRLWNSEIGRQRGLRRGANRHRVAAQRAFLALLRRRAFVLFAASLPPLPTTLLATAGTGTKARSTPGPGPWALVRFLA